MMSAGFGAFGAAHHDAVDVNALPFADDEARARAGSVGREVEQGAHFGEGKALFFEGVENAMARRLDLGLRNRTA